MKQTYEMYEFATDLETYQLHKLNQMLSFLMIENEFYKEKLRDVRLPLLHKSDIRQLPFVTKEELVQDQLNFPPYGRNHTYPMKSYSRYHQTSGTSGKPLKVLDTKESWEWWERCWVDVLKASKVTENDHVFLAFSFGPFIGFWGGFEAAKKIGAFVIAAGSQTSKERITTMLENNTTVLLCTPSYALHLLEVGEEMGVDLKNSTVEKIITAGEPGGSIPSTRKMIEEGWGAILYDHVGMTETGAYGYSCKERAGIHVNESHFIAEVIDTTTLQPVPEGMRGELVITNLGRYGYPLVRYRTGDIVINGGSSCTCQSEHLHLPGGIIGRVDDMVVIRGINIYPSSIESIVREFHAIKEFRIIYYTEDEMDQIKVMIESEDAFDEKILANRLRERVGLRIDVEKTEQTLERFSMKARRIIDRREK